jgi:hypothetical protein
MAQEMASGYVLAHVWKSLCCRMPNGSACALMPGVGKQNERTRSRFGMHRSELTAGGISARSGLLVIALAPNMLLVVLGWCLAQMSLHAPRLGSPLALLSSFKLFLIARAIGGSGLGMSCA